MYFLAYQDVFSCISEEYTWNKYKCHFQLQHSAKKRIQSLHMVPNLRKTSKTWGGLVSWCSFSAVLCSHPVPGCWWDSLNTPARALGSRIHFMNTCVWCWWTSGCDWQLLKLVLLQVFILHKITLPLLWGLAVVLLHCGYSVMAAFPTHPVPTWVRRA